MQYLPDALSPLAAYPQFILWKIAERKGKKVKLPVNYLTTEVCDAHDSSAWTTADVAIRTAKLFGDEFGVGFVFTANDPFYFVDIDKCLDGNDWSVLAKTVLGFLPGAAVEISQSGTGLHIIGKGTAPEHSCKNISLGLEFYTQDRFVALTGTGIIGSADTDSTLYLPSLVGQFFPPKTGGGVDNWTTGPVDNWRGYEDDDELIAKALQSKSTASKFGNGVCFADLWNKNVQALSDAYQPDSGDIGQYDESSADAALAQHLAFWTGNDCERIKRLMLRSSLVREKWDRQDYIDGTIQRAVSMQETVYTGKQSVATAAEGEFRSGFQYMDVTRQLEHFAGCYYVTRPHKVLTPDGELLKQEQFNAEYGGYVFQLDPDFNGKTTKKAWEVFTESQAYVFPKVKDTVFRPDLQPGRLDNRLVNIYRDPEVPRVQGDASKFVNHLVKLLPVERDRRILLSYMAACVQHKGTKFQWAPLIQGVQGNGKTLFTYCLEYALGEQYVHWPPVHEIHEKFNEWLFNKLLICMEDVYFPDHKQDVVEILKPMITGTRLAKRGMQQAQVMAGSVANFMLNSNHKNAIRITVNDRRYCVFYTAQQHIEDLERDGMTDAYFTDLYNWLKGEGAYESYGRGYGFSIVHNFLAEYHIDAEFNPARGCQRAPATSSSEEAREHSKGYLETEIEECIENGTLGFQGGWISVHHLRLLLSQLKVQRISRGKVKEILQQMGYVLHPSLYEGRTGGLVPLDGNKRSTLYIKKNHLASNLKGTNEIVEAYTKAQAGCVPLTMAATKFM